MNGEMVEISPDSDVMTSDSILTWLRDPVTGKLHPGDFVDLLSSEPVQTMDALLIAASDLGLEPDEILDAVEWEDDEEVRRMNKVFGRLINEGGING